MQILKAQAGGPFVTPHIVITPGSGLSGISFLLRRGKILQELRKRPVLEVRDLVALYSIGILEMRHDEADVDRFNPSASNPLRLQATNT